MENGKYVEGSLWFYAPNKGAPVFFAALFAISGVIHGYQCFRYKSWKVSGVLPWSAIIFTAGYIMREIGAFHYNNLNIFISSLVLIYVAPPLYELANYLILSRCLYYIPYYSPIHPGRVLSTFAAISVVIEALNGNGAAIVANSSNTERRINLGKALLKAALVLQLVVLSLFVLLAATFHKKCKRAGLLPTNLKAVLLTLYVSSFLIGTRTIFRTIEYFTTSGIHFSDPNLRESDIPPVFRYEWFFYIFESVLMAVNSIMLNVRHPMRFLPRNNKIYLAEDGVTEVEGEGYEDKRSFIVTVVDPFDLYGMLKGRNMRQKFWETHNEGRSSNEPASVEMERNGASKTSAV